VILITSLIEGPITGYHEVEDDSEGKNVGGGTFVALFFWVVLDFGGHVGSRSDMGAKWEFFFAFEILTGTKVSHFNNHFFVYKTIFQLQITMRHPLFMHISNTLQNLPEDCPAQVRL
jgi:hypothetical protein